MRKLKQALALLLALAMLLSMAAFSEEALETEQAGEQVETLLEEAAEELTGEEAAEEPVEEEPVEEEAIEEPAEGEAAEEPVAEEPAEEPVEGEPAEEPEAEEPAEEEPAEEMAEELPAEAEGVEARANNTCPESPDGYHSWGYDEDTYLSTGICEYCGYKCPHPKGDCITYNDDLDVVGSKPFDGSYHIETFNIWNLTRCDVCGYIRKNKLIQSNVTRKDPHDFHDYSSWSDEPVNVCCECGYDRSTGCQHPNRRNEIDRYDWENPADVTETASGDEGHLVSGMMAYNEVCADCGYVFVEHPYGQYTNVLEKHDYNSNSKCSFCGHKYSKTCSHTYEYSGADKNYTLYYINKNNDTYHYLHLKDAEGICTKCGHVKYFTKAQDIKQKHVFVAGNPACVVCGYKAQPTSVTINTPATAQLTLGGDTLALSAKIGPEGIESAILWTSSNHAVATVSGAGVVTAVGAGKAKITAKSENGKASKPLEITVIDPAIPTSLALPKTLSGTLGEPMDLKSKLTSLAPATAQLKWSSSKPEIVSVDPATGAAEMLDTGSAKITVTAATASGKGVKTATTTISVTDPKAPTSITLSPAGKISMTPADAPKAITPTLNAEAQGSCEILWSSSKPDVAQVDAQGNVTAISKGKAKITATAAKKNNQGKKVSASVTVQVTGDTFKPTGIVLSQTAPLSLTTDSEPVQITATIQPEGAQYGGVNWTNSNSYAVKMTVDANGAVTLQPKAAGTAKITATAKKDKKVKQSIEITVSDSHAITSFKLEQTGTVKVLVGGELQLKPVFGSESEKSDVVYTAKKNGGIIKLDAATGLIQGLKPGKVQITAKTAKKVGSGKKAAAKSAKVTIQVVDPKSPAKIEIDQKGTLEYATVGKPEQLTCTITLEDGTQTKAGVKWSVKDAKKALIDDEGKFYAISPGKTVTVTATTDANSCSGKPLSATISIKTR